MIRKANLLVLLGFGLCLASPTYAQQADSSSPDLVLINGKVLTMDDRSSVVEALAVLDGKILATGSNASVERPWRRSGAFRIAEVASCYSGLPIATFTVDIRPGSDIWRHGRNSIA
jgi:hypothetical protein